jgi:hypothetical protein
MNNPLDWLTLQKRISDYSYMQDRLIALLREIIFDSGEPNWDGWMESAVHSKTIEEAYKLIAEAEKL